MNNAALDNILRTLLEKHGTGTISSVDFNASIGEWDWDSINFLESKGFVRVQNQPQAIEPFWFINLTSTGKYFIENSSFEKEEYLKNEPIKISRKAFNFSIYSLIISCLVALFVGFIQLKCNNTQGKEIYYDSSNQKSVSSPHVSDTIHKSKIVK